MEVVAAVLLRRGEDGKEQFLLAQRPEGKVYAGYWEFPGGKVESGETGHQALVRELQEELGIGVEAAWPWLSREFSYPHADVRLKFFRITAWHGDIAPLEHSGFAWVTTGAAPAVSPILPANGPILRALDLPGVYALTAAEENGVEAELARLEHAFAAGLRLVQVRDKGLPAEERRRLAAGAVALAAKYPSCRVLINADAGGEALAQEVGADGIHLSATGLAMCTSRPDFPWVVASCHNAEELARAATLNLDFAVLGPVLPTPTHPETPGLGWTNFAALLERSPLPVFALGGLRREMLETARAHGAHGIAQMRGWS